MTEQVTVTQIIEWLFNDTPEEFCLREIPKGFDLQGLTVNEFSALLLEKMTLALKHRFFNNSYAKTITPDEARQIMKAIGVNFILLAGKWNTPRYIEMSRVLEEICEDFITETYKRKA